MSEQSRTLPPEALDDVGRGAARALRPAPPTTCPSPPSSTWHATSRTASHARPRRSAPSSPASSPAARAPIRDAVREALAAVAALAASWEA